MKTPPGVKRRRWFLLKCAGTTLFVVMICGIVYEYLGQRQDRARLPQIGRSIDIGDGRTLNIYCSGEGTPAVIFDGGNGEPGYAWSHIQPEVAKQTRACWFDRAGEGWSDTGPFPRTAVAMSNDLHELLHRAGVPAPYILVGHSMGGLNARVYSGIYPSDIAGAVLVDAEHEDEQTRAPAFMLGHTAPAALRRPIWIAGQTARLVGLLRLTTPRGTGVFDTALAARLRMVRLLMSQPKAVATQFDASLPDSYQQASRSKGFGDRPLVVLTRGKIDSTANPSSEDREYIDYERIWAYEIQPKLAALSTRGRQVIVAKSGHRIPDEAPEAVIEAIFDVLNGVRSTVNGAAGSAVQIYSVPLRL